MNEQFNRERVDDLTNTVLLGCNSAGNPEYGHIDKLACVTDLFDQQQNEELVNRLFALQSGDHYKVRRRPAGKDECKGLYRSVVEIRLADKPAHHPLLLAIHYVPTSKKRGVMRMELSPQHYTADQITDIFIWLGRKGRLGKHLYRGLRNAWVTTIHYALDVVGMKLHDYLISLSKVHDGEFHDLHGEQEGLRLGSTTLVASVYAKLNVPELSVDERYAMAQLMLEKYQFERFLRLELRFSPGKQKLMLGKLSQMENLVSRLAFYDREIMKDSKLEPDFAKCLMKMPVPHARATFSPANVLNGKVVSPTRKAALKRVTNVMKKHRVMLFDAEVIWQKLPLVIQKLGILDQPQYWSYRNRIKWLKKRDK